jgi:hypothetical protein
MNICVVQTGRLRDETRNCLRQMSRQLRTVTDSYGQLREFKATTLSLRLMYLKSLSFLRFS